MPSPAADTFFRPIQLDASAGSDTLVRFAFGEPGPGSGDAVSPFDVELARLSGPVGESWIRTDRVQEGQRNGVRYRHDNHWLMGALRVDGAQSEDIEAAADEAFRTLRHFVSACGFPQLLRVWNFFDRLNEGEGDAERYRRFCVGRHRALAEPGFESQLPAATVIGSQVPGLHIQFLAGRVPGVQVENPRQTSAFRYPRDYGPSSPSFSRATRVGDALLVSGTAAVVGHASLHPGDAVAQIDEIDTNVAALLDHASAGRVGRWQARALRLYLRRDADLPAVLPRVRESFGHDAPITVLRGDISRADLVVEIEGVWTFQSQP